MKLVTRLTLVSAIVTTTSTLVIGGIGINSQHDSQIALLDKSINQVAKSIHGKTTSALSEALFAVEESDVSLSLIYFLNSKSPTLLTESNAMGVTIPTAREIASSFSRPVSHQGVSSFRMRSVRLMDNEYLVIAASLGGIDSRYATDRWHLFLFIFLSLLIAILTTWYFIRRDIREIESLIEAAIEISDGNSDREIETNSGNSEVAQLSNSLSRMVQSLRRMAKAEEESASRMQTFLGDASHELRTPLTVIKGYIELLSNTSFSDESQRSRAYSRVQSEILRMQTLIDDLLFLAEFGLAPKTTTEKIDLSTLVLEHLHDFQILGSDRKTKSEIESGLAIKGSKSHIERMLSNIFGNVLRHTPSKAPIHVSLTSTNTEIHLVIEDGGPGLPASAYELGLQNFERFDRSRSRQGGGSGLGMSIIFAVVKEHGGTIHLEPSSLGGVTVRVNFAKLV